LGEVPSNKAIQGIYQQIREVLIQARGRALQAVNTEMVACYWQIGRLIVEEEQQGEIRAEYGKRLIRDLSKRLSEEFGKGFDRTNLQHMRAFYLGFSNCDALRRELSWTHYRLLLRVEKPEARSFYEIDLKVGDLTHQDFGQMQMYLNYYHREMTTEEENPPIGIILCSDKSDAVVRYTLPEDNKQIFASRYKLYLPTEEELAAEIIKERQSIEMERRLSGKDSKA